MLKMRRRAATVAPPHLSLKAAQNLRLPWLGRCHGGWILGVELYDERLRDIQRVREADDALNFRHVKYQRDAMSFRVSVERLANLVINRSEEFALALFKRSLRIFSLTLKVLLHLIDFVGLLLCNFRILHRRGRLESGRRLVDLSLQ